MRQNRQMAKRIISGMLAALFLTQAGLAAAPRVETDEAVYVNLNYYGALSDLRVVKGVSLNGQTNFTDYGNYSKVINMTGLEKPKLSAGQVSWSLKSAEDPRFYYECTPKNAKSIQMPWNFDVTYRLNGQQTRADQLYGKKGTVEIQVKATPNKNASTYYRDNMMLLVMQGIDMSKNYSIEADGAQIQSLGTYKAATFIGLPGETCTFTTYIGSNAFDYPGTYLMMAPVTSSIADRITDIRKAKDKLENASDSLFTGLNAMLDTVNSMKSGMSTLDAGISGLDSAREQLKSADPKNDAEMEQALSDAKTAIDQLDAEVPELQDLVTVLTTANTTANSTLNKLYATKSDISSYQKLLKTLYSNLGELVDMLDDFNSVTYKNGDYDYVLKNLHTSLNDMRDSSTNLKDSLAALESSLGNMKSELQNAISGLEQLSASDPTKYAGDIASLTALQGMLTAVGGMLPETESMLSSVATLSSAMNSLVTLVDEYRDVLKDHDDDLSQTLGTMQKLLAMANSTLGSVDSMLDDIPTMQKTLNQGTDDMTSMLQKSTQQLTSAKQALTSAHTSLSDMRQTLLSVRDQANGSTKQTVNGMLDMLQKGIASTATDKVKDANSAIHNTTKNEFNKIDNETNLLDIDNSLSLQSVTSAKNPAPSSLQFIVRTQEISENVKEKEAALEPSDEDAGVWTRIVNIFKKIESAVRSIMSEG